MALGVLTGLSDLSGLRGLWVFGVGGRGMRPPLLGGAHLAGHRRRMRR